VTDIAERRAQVLHILPTLGMAGAEHVAAYLLLRLATRFDMAAVSLYARRDSAIEKSLAQSGIPLRHFGKHVGFDPRMFLAIERALAGFRPDIVHTHLYVLPYVVPAFLRWRPRVWIHTVHTLAEHETDRMRRYLQFVLFRMTTVPVAVSEAVAESLERRYKLGPVIIIRNGICIAESRRNSAERARWRRAEGFDEQDIIVTSVGRLDVPKNPLLLIRAFAELSAPRSRLVLIGQGPLREQVVREAEKLHIVGRLHLLGERDDIPLCLAGSDIFALASDWEGSPLSVMEAMAAGLPVICTAVGGVPELIRSGTEGILVPPGDCGALRDAIRRMVESAPLRASMGRAGQARAEAEFDVARMVEAYGDLYSRLLAGRGAPGAAYAAHA
jgi:glycosyltransferase involved in cell wall biosynthesis